MKHSERGLLDNIDTPHRAIFEFSAFDAMFIKPVDKSILKERRSAVPMHGDVYSLLTRTSIAFDHGSVSVQQPSDKGSNKTLWNRREVGCETFGFGQTDFAQKLCDSRGRKDNTPVSPIVLGANAVRHLYQGLHDFKEIIVLGTNLNTILEQASVRPDQTKEPRQFTRPSKKEIFVEGIAKQSLSLSSALAATIIRCFAHWLTIGNSHGRTYLIKQRRARLTTEFALLIRVCCPEHLAAVGASAFTKVVHGGPLSFQRRHLVLYRKKKEQTTGQLTMFED